MIGLHTCGDLAATCIRLFCESDSDSLVNVGCCYHLVSCATNYIDYTGDVSAYCFPADRLPSHLNFSSQPKPKHFGFPLSNFLATMWKDIGMAVPGRRTFALSCHAVDSFLRSEQDMIRLERNMEKNAFRAMLQIVFRRHYGMAAQTSTFFPLTEWLNTQGLEQEWIIIGRNVKSSR